MSKGQRKRDLTNVGFLYTKKFKKFDRCVYCGDPQECWDHVLPVSVASQLDKNALKHRHKFHQGFNLVPSCNDCNKLAGDEPFLNILDKRSFIKSQIKSYHKKALNAVEWEPEELEDLGESMRKQVEYAAHQKHQLELRVSYPEVRV